jgi:hypothetical protein
MGISSLLKVAYSNIIEPPEEDLLFESSNDNTRVISTLQKYTFIMNALDNGWRVKKRHNKFFFTKKHKGKKTFFMKGFLDNFIEMNILPESEVHD